MADFSTPKDFEKVRKGYSPKQVESFAEEMSSKLNEAQEQIDDLNENLKLTQRQLEQAKTLDEETLTEHLGTAAARLLNAARREAGAKEKEAESEAEEILNQAKREAEEIRARAETAFNERIVAAKAESEHLQAEADSVRHKTLLEMNRRRKEANAQVERLKAGRDKLMTSVDTSQRLIDEIKDGLTHSLSEAKTAADDAARRVMSQPEPTPKEIEEEIAAAKLLEIPGSSFTPDPPTPKTLAEITKHPIEESPAIEEKVGPPVEEIKEPEPVEEEVTFHTYEPDPTHSLFERLKSEQKTQELKEKTQETEVEVEEVEKVEEIEEIVEEEPEPEPEPPIDTLAKALERQLKQAIALDQNQVLDTLRQKRKKELPPIESQSATYLSAIQTEELEAIAGTKINIPEELLLEFWVQPLRNILEECFREEATDAPKEVRNSYRDFKQNECSSIALALSKKILEMTPVK